MRYLLSIFKLKPKIMDNIGKNIRLLRHQRGWSQEHVAGCLGISIPAYSKIETGITDINLSRIEQIAELFELSAIQLLMLGDQNNQKFLDDVETLNRQLADKELEVIALQKKVIGLFEALREDVPA
jgi:transcriptional regulator with XRE-family HTH domain